MPSSAFLHPYRDTRERLGLSAILENGPAARNELESRSDASFITGVNVDIDGGTLFSWCRRRVAQASEQSLISSDNELETWYHVPNPH